MTIFVFRNLRRLFDKFTVARTVDIAHKNTLLSKALGRFFSNFVAFSENPNFNTERPQLFEFEVATCKTFRLRSKKAILEVATSNLQKMTRHCEKLGSLHANLTPPKLVTFTLESGIEDRAGNKHRAWKFHSRPA